ncbi:MAG: hypothetical protein AAFX52_12545 [Pseudomonadota bacterium]
MFKRTLSAVAAATLNLGIAVSTAGFSAYAEAPLPRQSHGYETVEGLEIFSGKLGTDRTRLSCCCTAFQAHPISTETSSMI